jgi:putative oxidoreductase
MNSVTHQLQPRSAGVRRLANAVVRLPSLAGSGQLVLRLVVGATFLAHGVDKLADPAGTEQFFVSLGIPAAGMMGPFVSVTETVGGALLIAGLATPLVGLALAGDMLVAVLTAHIGHGFFASDGGPELPLLLGGASLALALMGAGRFSLDEAVDLPRRLRRALGASTRSQLIHDPKETQ